VAMAMIDQLLLHMMMNIERGRRREGKEKRQKGERIGRVSEVT